MKGPELTAKYSEAEGRPCLHEGLTLPLSQRSKEGNPNGNDPVRGLNNRPKRALRKPLVETPQAKTPSMLDGVDYGG